MFKNLSILIIMLLTLNNHLISQNIFKKDNNQQKIGAIEIKTKDCKVYDGLFKIYQNKKDGKSFIEIDTSHLEKEYIYFSYIENGITDAWLMKGSYRGSKIIKINKFFDRIEFTIHNTKYFFNEDSPLSKASKSNISTPLIISEKIITNNKEKTRFLISADNIFLNESFQQIKYSYSPGYKGFKIGNLSKSKTKFHQIRSYPENTDVIVNYTYENKYPSTKGRASVTDSRVVSVLVQHSLIRMPENNYKPRYDDTRVGYFTTKTNHMTTLDRVNYRDFIHRWNLIKKDPSKALSEPVEPIIWWIENTTPYELRDIIKDGVESWNIAFEKAGFNNAIIVKIQSDTANWDAGDIRYNVLRWTSSPNPPWGGYGPSFVNPRTGQILGADIMLEWSYITRRISEDNLFNNLKEDLDNHYCTAAKHQQIETSFGVDYIKTFDLGSEIEEELVKQSLYRLVLHEVGHTLGLNHNFKGSTLLTTDELNNKEIVNKKGVCNSVMEYPAINITKKSEDQGLFFDIKPGLYDIWAIQFGYSQYTDNEIEKTSIEEILSRSTEQELAFANDALDMRSPGKGSDPNAMIYDLSSNPIEHSLQRMDMIINILKRIKEKYTKNNDTYQELYRSYRTLVYSYFNALEIISRQIGGVHIDLSHIDQNIKVKPFESVSLEKQLKAIKVISEYGFSNKVLLQEDLFPFLQSQRRGFDVSSDPSIHQRILIYQNRLLDHLLNSAVLQRITNSALYGNEYDLTRYMIDLRNSIFSSDMNSNISSVRQNLQISYIKRLINIIKPTTRYDNISQSAAYYNINWLKKNINTRTGNLSSRQHKEYLLYLIDSIENK